MPIFRITATEEVKRQLVAYVDAPTQASADNWASNAPDSAFRHVKDVGEPWCEVETIEPIDEPPAGWRVSSAS